MVDREFDRGQQLGYALLFIEYHPLWKACHKPYRVIACCGEHGAVVEGDVGASRFQLAGQGRFTDLARAKNAHHRGITEGIQYLLLQVAWVEICGHGST